MITLAQGLGGAAAATAVGTCAAVWRAGSSARAASRTRQRIVRAATPTPTAVPRARGDAAPTWLAERLHDAGVDTHHCFITRSWCWAVAGTGVFAVLSGGPAFAALVLAAVVAAPLVALWLARDRGDRLLEAALPEALDAIARTLRSGSSVRQALEDAAGNRACPRLAAELDSVVASARGGRSLGESLDAWAARRPLPGVRLTVAALAVAGTSGGPPARAVEGVAATIRARLAVAAEVRSLGSQARYSALVIGLAPIAFMGLAAGTDGPTAAFLFRTAPGLVCLTAGLLLDAAGALWMHRIAAAGAW